MTKELRVFLDTRQVGRLVRDARGRLSLVYDDAWRTREDAHPVSLSMPLAQKEHGHSVVNPFVWGLLPDNEIILERWAKRFHVSARNAFALLGHVGDDCAGAVRFLPADADAPGTHGAVTWLDEKQIAARLRELRSDVSAWRSPEDAGQFSLGGAQPKTALLFDGRRWGVPSGLFATTHILKPGIADLDGHAENEHFCLDLARALGIPAVTSQVMRFEDEVAIVVERYDRRRSRGELVRIHQEDLCQALAVHPVKKYENDGGPGVRAVVELLRSASNAPTEDVNTFLDAVALNWLIGGTDAHAKNFSILIGGRGRVRLAPLYDVASVLPYARGRERKLKLAMKIGGKYRLHEIGLHAWTRLARELKLDPEHVRIRVLDLSDALPDQLADVVRRARAEGLRHPILSTLASTLKARAAQCSRELRL